MAKSDFDAEVMGLEDIPEGQRPPVLIPHLAFQVMVGAGVAMLALVVWATWLLWKKHDLATHPLFLRLASFSGPLGLLAVEAGWCVTEVGRQPWIIRGVLLVSEAVTPMPGLIWSLLTSLVVYGFLGVVVVVLLYRHVVSVPLGTKSDGRGLDDASKVPAE
jgi:cytochrome d ubiquinol oxidase subunit I